MVSMCLMIVHGVYGVTTQWMNMIPCPPPVLEMKCDYDYHKRFESVTVECVDTTNKKVVYQGTAYLIAGM